MNSSVNRSSESPTTSGTQLPETMPETNSIHSQQPEMPIGDSETTTNSVATTDSTEAQSANSDRQQPIPPPSEPMQYRAIGLIRGKYMPSAEQLTRGTLLTTDGTLIDAVLLGRVMSLVKNHLSLDQDHLWVVYPRTRQEEEQLHVQIVGVWEPEKLNKTPSNEPNLAEETNSEAEEKEQVAPEVPEANGEPDIQEGYFSIRGEVIYQSRENEDVIVKILQSPRRDSERAKLFKLKLKGYLGSRVVGHFWDLHAQLQANTLQIQEANDICQIPSQKPRKRKNGNNRKRRRPARPMRGSNQSPIRHGDQAAPKRKEPLPKPVKRGNKSSEGNTSENSA